MSANSVALSSFCRPIDEKFFYSKNDKNDIRLGDLVKPLDFNQIEKGSVVFLGYPDDEGIHNLKGRPGAAFGPDSIRESLYRRTPSFTIESPRIFDAGNLLTKPSLIERHGNSQRLVSHFLTHQACVVTWGGGHDYAYPDLAAFCEHTLSSGHRPVVFNFDAHLDVRPDSNSITSGTPFYRLLEKFEKHLVLFQIGIQDWCNSKAHLEWALDHGAHVITLNEILDSNKSLVEVVVKKMSQISSKNDRLALSVDIDGFTSAIAPGASQSFPIGLDATDYLAFQKYLTKVYHPQMLGIYEVSPPLDQDQKTSHLASILTHQFIYSK